MTKSFLEQKEKIMTYQRIEVLDQTHHDKKMSPSFPFDLDGFQIFNVFHFEGPDQIDLDILEKILSDKVGMKFYSQDFSLDAHFLIDIHFRPGVTDNLATTTKEALALFDQYSHRVGSGLLLAFKGQNLDQKNLEKFAQDYFANPLIQQIHCWSIDSLEKKERFSKGHVPEVQLRAQHCVQSIDLDQSLDDLEKMSSDNCWALSRRELETIKNHFQKENPERNKRQLLAQLTDVEMEIIAQTWSEHCKHKIFNAQINFTDSPQFTPQLGQMNIQSLFKTYIQKTTQEIIEKEKITWTKSLFKDNAGVIRFDEQVDLCFKVETHNSPSALDPYGGALTGILGVNRDILGCGLGARPIANTDIFCVGPYHFPIEKLPRPLLSPRRILEGVHRGVMDGGNKSGIPTVNGSMQFDENYSGKPLIFVGTLGVMPQELADGRLCYEKEIKNGDLVVVAGGAVGKDGIHGATFSSLELDENAPATAVQIGDPLTQKRLSEFTLEARDKGLFRAITDNGAGGISSSIGEMATLCGGAKIDLAKVPLKYPGLSVFEIMISESQERMSYAVPPEMITSFLELANLHQVQADVLGEFNETGWLEVFYGDQCHACLDLEFLHDGAAPLQLKANFQTPIKAPWFEKTKLKFKKDWRQTLMTLLSSHTICSKKHWVAQYDQQVQAASLVTPYLKGPSDAGVLWAYPHGGSKQTAWAVSHGLAPQLSEYDTYHMAQYSLDEAVRNLVATGVNPKMIALLDNFCWPDPVESEKNIDGAYKCAQLVRACHGMREAAMAYGLPFISGKDSMKNDFVGVNKEGEKIKISVPPTLLISAVGQISQIESITTTDFKKQGDCIYHLGAFDHLSLAYSQLGQIFDYEDSRAPGAIDLNFQRQLYEKIYHSVQKKWLSSCHDISEGGALVSVTESLLGTHLGAEIEIFDPDPWAFAFSEQAGRFIVSVAADKVAEFEQYWSKNERIKIGEVTASDELVLKQQNQILAKWNLSELAQSYSGDWS